MTSVYALVDPRSQAIRYIGRTTDLPGRYRNHLSIGGGYHPAGQEKHAWIAELRDMGKRPSLVVLEECGDKVAHMPASWSTASIPGPMGR